MNKAPPLCQSCCGPSEWVDNGPRLQYFYCGNCKSEVQASVPKLQYENSPEFKAVGLFKQVYSDFYTHDWPDRSQYDLNMPNTQCRTCGAKINSVRAWIECTP